MDQCVVQEQQPLLLSLLLLFDLLQLMHECTQAHTHLWFPLNMHDVKEQCRNMQIQSHAALSNNELTVNYYSNDIILPSKFR